MRHLHQPERHPLKRPFRTTFLGLVLMLACVGQFAIAEDSPVGSSRFFDPEDGFLDLSSFIDEPRGFIPLISPITEPAVGYGAMVAPIFIQPNDPAPDGRRVRPNLATIGGFATEGNSTGWFGAWSASWLDGRLETKASILGADLNLDFYGAGLGVGPGLQSLGYELDLTGGMVESRYRLGDSPWMLGLRYLYATADSTFRFQLPIGVRTAELSSTLGGPSLIASYDSRDNIFTPSSGSLFEGSTTFHDPVFGADASHQRFDLVGLHFHPLRHDLTFGIKGQVAVSAGETPFFALPFVQLRGVPAQRYQGRVAASLESEIRWQMWKRFSVVAFGGIGAAGRSIGDLEDPVVAGGTGFRYEIARKHKIHMGLDVGFSEDDTALYVVFGSAWMRP